MSETLRDHTLAWLDSIGADGLMIEGGYHFLPKDTVDIFEKMAEYYEADYIGELVPAYRHADGSYHTFPEFCLKCLEGDALFAEECFTDEICATYKDHIKHKEAPK